MKGFAWRIFLRSLSIQASYNDRKMQNIGFAFTMAPLIHHLPGGEKGREDFLRRHLTRFNTHPYFSGAIAGSVTRMETEEPPPKTQEIETLKNTLAAPYAALGDSFFWGAARPFAATAAVLITWSGSSWAPWFFLLSFAMFYFYVRAGGFIHGYHQGLGGYDFLRSLNLPRATAQLRRLTLGAALAMVILLTQGILPGYEDPSKAILPVALLAVPLFYWLIGKGFSTMLLFYLAVVVFFIISVLWS
jgi:PTS system mannose-specific IID component